MGAALVGNNFWPIPSTFYFTWKKKWLVAAWNLQSIKTLLTLELSQYLKSGSMFSSSKQVAALSDCSLIGNTLCLCWAGEQPQEAGEMPQEPKNQRLLAVGFAF